VGDDVDLPLRVRTEWWFLRRGVPHLIEDYNAGENIWTRARPFLILVVLLQTLVAFNDRFEGIAQGAMSLLAAALLLAALALFNRMYRRRMFEVPREVNLPELSFFVLTPAAIALVVSGDPLWTAFLIVVLNVIVLGVTYFVVGFGILPMTKWAISMLLKHVLVLVRLTARTLPVLLVVTVFMFINAEIWQIASLIEPPGFVIVISAIMIAGLSFIWITSVQFLARIRQPTSWPEAHERASDSPLSNLATPQVELETEPLRRGVQYNLRILLLASVGTQMVLVGALVGVFYTGIGLIFITPEVLEVWTGSGNTHTWIETSLDGLDLVLTREHVRVSALVAALAGLNVAVSALTDDAYRETFTADLVEEMEQNLAVRALYRTLPVEHDRLVPQREDTNPDE
jgi:hypothetical protein